MSTNADRGRSTGRVSGVQRAFEQRISNPLLLRLLRSRVHWPFSRWLVLVSYEGRRSGNRYTLPVVYSRCPGGIVVVTPKPDTVWWRNFARSRPCTVWFRGSARTARGELASDRERRRLLDRYAADHRLTGRMLELDDAVYGGDGDDASTADLAVVRFTFTDE